MTTDGEALPEGWKTVKETIMPDGRVWSRETTLWFAEGGAQVTHDICQPINGDALLAAMKRDQA